MTDTPNIDTLELLELDAREADGITVTLLWCRAMQIVLLRVEDSRLGTSFELDVAPHLALDAFRHPFAYAAIRGALDRSADGAHLPAPSAGTVA